MPAKLQHEQEFQLYVEAAWEVELAARKARIAAQQAQQAQQSYILKEVAQQVEARTARFAEDLESAQQEAASNAALAQQAHQAQQDQNAQQTSDKKKAERLQTANAKLERKLNIAQQAAKDVEASGKAQLAQQAQEAQQQAQQAQQAMAAEVSSQVAAQTASLRQELLAAQQLVEEGPKREADNKAAQAQEAQQAQQAMAAQVSRQVQAETAKLLHQAQQAVAAQVAWHVAQSEQAAADAKLAQQAEAAKQAEDSKQRATSAWCDTISTLHSLVPQMWGPDVMVTPTLQMPAYTAAQPELHSTAADQGLPYTVKEPKDLSFAGIHEDVSHADVASAVTNAEACLAQRDFNGALGHYTEVCQTPPLPSPLSPPQQCIVPLTECCCLALMQSCSFGSASADDFCCCLALI